MNEHQAILRLKQGDPTGLEFLVKQYQVIAIRTVYLIVGDRPAAEDIVQAAFIRAYERIQQFDEQRSFRPWFLRMVANDAIKHVTRQKQVLSLDTESTDTAMTLLQSLIDPLPDPHTQAETAELRQTIWQALQKLPAEQRAALVMRYYLDFSEAEIAQETESPGGTVKWRLHAARKGLRRLLRPLNSE